MAISLAMAFALGKTIESVLYEVSGAGPMTCAEVTVLIAAGALLAAWLAARRATRLGPVRALRDERHHLRDSLRHPG